MSEDPSTLIVEADIPAPEAEEVLDTTATDDELLNHALDDLFGLQTGGGPPKKKKRGEPEPESEPPSEPEEENFLDRARRLQREARGAGDGAGDVTMSGPAGAGAGSAVPATPSQPASGTTILPHTRAAASNLVKKFEDAAAGAGEAADKAGAWALTNLPGFLTATATGVATKAVIDNPYTVAQLADTLMGVATAAVERLAAGPDVGQYTRAVETIARSMGDFAGAVRDAATAGPGFGISVALLILRYRAHHGGAGSLTGQILADARAVANLATAIMSTAVGAGAGAAPTAQEAVSMASEYFFAAIVEAARRAREATTGALGTLRAEASVAALREGAAGTKRKRPSGPGAEEMTAAVGSAGPLAAGPGPVPDTIAVASSRTPPDLRTVIDRLAGIPQGEKSALKDLLAGAGKAVVGFGKGVGATVAGLGAGAGAMVSGVGRRLSGVFGQGQGSGVAPSDVPLPRTGTGPIPQPSSLLPPPRVPIEERAREPRGLGAGAGEAPPEDVAMSVPGAAAPMDVDKPEEEEKKGGRRRKTSKNKRRKTYRKKGKKTRGKTRGRRAFIY